VANKYYFRSEYPAILAARFLYGTLSVRNNIAFHSTTDKGGRSYEDLLERLYL
jgi:hypothetical protein